MKMKRLSGITCGLLVLSGCVWGRYGCLSGHYETWETGDVQLRNGVLFCLLRHQKCIAPFTWGPYGIPYGRGWKHSETIAEQMFALHILNDANTPVSSPCDGMRPVEWLNAETENNKWSWMYHYAFLDEQSIWRLRPHPVDVRTTVSPLSGDVIKANLVSGITESFTGPARGDGFHGHPGGLSPMYCLEGTALLYWDVERLSWVSLESQVDFREICKLTMDGWNCFRGDFLVSRDGSEFHCFLGGVTNHGFLFHANLRTGATNKESVRPPMDGVRLQGWDIPSSTEGQDAVLLWKKDKVWIVSTPSGNMLERWQCPGNIGTVRISADEQCLYGCLFPSGSPNSYGVLNDNAVAHGHYPCSIFVKNWASGEFRLFPIPPNEQELTGGQIATKAK